MWEFTRQVDIAAPPERVWEIVTDVSRHPELAGSGEVKAVRMHGPLAEGSTWAADEQIRGMGSFTATSECVELSPPHTFSWRSMPPPLRKGREDSVPDVTWWFTLEPTTTGTRVEHRVRIVEPPWPVARWMMKAVYGLGRRGRTVQRGMEATLDNVKKAAEAPDVAADN